MGAHNVLKHVYDADHALADPGNGKAIIPTQHCQLVSIVTAAAETRSLPAPAKVGILFGICMDTDGGDCVITASAGVNTAENTSITLN